MSKKEASLRPRLRLIRNAEDAPIESGFASPDNRRLVRKLTQDLVDAMIAINDLLDGNPELEPEEEDDDETGI